MKSTALAALNANRGWFQVETPPGPTAVLRSVVYVDGDVTTKVFGGQLVDPRIVVMHFDEIDRQASAASKQVRRIVQAIYAFWITITILVAAFVHNWPDSLIAAAAVLTPIVVDVIRSRLRALQFVTPQVSAVVSAIVVGLLAIRWDSRALAISAVITLALALGLWYARRKLRQLFEGA